MAFTNALAPEETWALGARMSKVFETPDFFVAELGPVIGVHVGPGTVGAAVVATN
jgi:fatty acid-binding protein DegV